MARGNPDLKDDWTMNEICIRHLSKEEWYTGVGELLGLCFQCLCDKLPIKAKINILFKPEQRGHKLASFD